MRKINSNTVQYNSLDEEKQIILKLPNDWKEVFPVIVFCKIYHHAISSLKAIKSPGNAYYHKRCISKSRLFKKMGGKILKIDNKNITLYRNRINHEN